MKRLVGSKKLKIWCVSLSSTLWLRQLDVIQHKKIMESSNYKVLTTHSDFQSYFCHLLSTSITSFQASGWPHPKFPSLIKSKFHPKCRSSCPKFSTEERTVSWTDLKPMRTVCDSKQSTPQSQILADSSGRYHILPCFACPAVTAPQESHDVLSESDRTVMMFFKQLNINCFTFVLM